MQLIPQQQVPSSSTCQQTTTKRAAVPTISYQPTDIIIPTQLYDKIGNLGEYKDCKKQRKVGFAYC